MKIYLKIIVLFIPFLTACVPGISEEPTSPIVLNKKKPNYFSKPEKLVEFIDNSANGFIKTKTIDAITYSAILKPVDYLLAQKKIEEQNPNLKKSDFEDLQYFDLRIKIEDFHKEFIKYDLKSEQQYQERVQYCAFQMQKDIKLIDGLDTLDCVLYHYERAFDIIPFGHFILGFEPRKDAMVATKTLFFYDQLFNNGIIKFTFSPEIMVREPML